MGRKVHPIGFRLGLIKDWRTRWYAEGSHYTQLLEEDRRIRRRILELNPNAAISYIEIERYPNEVTVTIHSARPGILIGRRGQNVNTLRNELQQLTDKRVKVDVKEVENPDLDARLVAQSLAEQLERRVAYKRAMKRAVERAIQAGAKGAMVTCGGRLAGAEMARRETVREGRVPRHTLRADIDYGQAEALTTFGRIGIKVWIYKGDVLPEKAAVAEAVAAAEG
ncbi:MAG: 30S ribosomal protein S3 [Anaerolineae bacterium]